MYQQCLGELLLALAGEGFWAAPPLTSASCRMSGCRPHTHSSVLASLKLEMFPLYTLKEMFQESKDSKDLNGNRDTQRSQTTLRKGFRKG